MLLVLLLLLVTVPTRSDSTRTGRLAVLHALRQTRRKKARPYATASVCPSVEEGEVKVKKEEEESACLPSLSPSRRCWDSALEEEEEEGEEVLLLMLARGEEHQEKQ